MSYIPFVIENKGSSERSYDIYSRLLEDRIIFIGDSIDINAANSIIAQLLLLDQKDKTRDIMLYINSGGGSVTSGMAIYDTMQYIKAPIMTVCVGEAASMAAIILAGGTAGKRVALPNSRIMIHEPRQTGYEQTCTVSEHIIDGKLLQDMRNQIAGILAKHTSKDIKKVLKDFKEDFWFKPEEALEYGLIDSIITSKT